MSTPSTPGSTSTLTRLRRAMSMVPDRTETIDLGAVGLLGILAISGLHLVYSGWWFLAVGSAGLVLGIFVAHVSNRLKQPAPVLALLVVAVFFLLGGAVALASGGGSAVPVPDTISTLADTLFYGWKELLTTLPPLNATGPLLVLPYVLGLIAGAGGTALARRTTSPLWSALTPVALLVVVILMGVQRPSSLLVQGGLFGLVLLGWLFLRSQRGIEPIRSGRGRLFRLGSSVAMLAVAAVVGIPLGSHAEPSGPDRVVLRTQIEPPFDIGQYASPLSSFRAYTKQKKPTRSNLYDKELFAISGVPDGTLVRIATLNAYDGVVWGAANLRHPGGVDDTYQRVSSTIANPIAGVATQSSGSVGCGQPVAAAHPRTARVTVTMAPAYRGVWLPSVGALTSLHFHGSGGEEKAGAFRYDLASSTGVVPTGLRAGDSYTFTANLPDAALTPTTQVLTGSSPVAGDSGFLDEPSTAWTKGSTTPLASVLQAASHLCQVGRYSDGDGGDAALYHPGHFTARLAEFVSGQQIVGNDEQYAATMALLANRLGVPARVVLGATVKDQKVTGKDVNAWVEVQAYDGWKTLSRSAFMGPRTPPEKTPPKPKSNFRGTVVPPAVPAPPPSSVTDPTDANQKARKASKHQQLVPLPGWVLGALAWISVPVLLVALIVALIVALKQRRRRRRRYAARISSRFVGGWEEILDRAAELGTPVRRDLTRRVQASTLDPAVLLPLAHHADDRVFGVSQPTAEEADDFWHDVERTLHEMVAGLTRWQRAKVRVSLVSFFQRKPRTG